MSIATSSSPTGIDPGTEVSLLSLLLTLTEEYPDLDGQTIARALERAATAADVLSPGLAHTHHQVEMLARDRLDAAAGHTAARRRNATMTAERSARVRAQADLPADSAGRPVQGSRRHRP